MKFKELELEVDEVAEEKIQKDEDWQGMMSAGYERNQDEDQGLYNISCDY